MRIDRRQLLMLALSAPLAAVVGCAALGGAPTVITLDPAELTTLIGRQFPLERRVLELFEVRADAPSLQLDPGRNLLALDGGFTARERVMRVAWRGRIAFDTGLRWDAAAEAVRLDRVRVRTLEFGDAEPARLPVGAASGKGIAERLRAVLAEQLLEGLAVWRLSAERKAQLGRLGLRPGAVTVTARGVEITLVAAG